MPNFFAARAEELAGKIIEACVEAGGSVTGEHGAGVAQKRPMPLVFGGAHPAPLQHLRWALDPRGAANPGHGGPPDPPAGRGEALLGPPHLAPHRPRAEQAAALAGRSEQAPPPRPLRGGAAEFGERPVARPDADPEEIDRNADHLIEKVGADLRQMMSWLSKKDK